MKKRHNKINKIICFSVLGLIGILLITMVTLMFVKKDFNVNLLTPYEMRIYSTESGTFYDYVYHSEDEQYKKINELFNDSFKDSLFNLIFSGNLEKENYIEDSNSNSNLVSNIISKNTDKHYLEFVYSAKKTLMINDKEYLTSSKNPVTYVKLLIEITENNDFDESKIYVESYSSYSSTDVISSSYQIMTYTNQSKLYSYIEDLTK